MATRHSDFAILTDEDAALDSFTPHPISDELVAIVDGAKGSLDLISLWCEARTDNAAVTKVIESIRTHGQDYCKAINISIETAQDCHILSHEAVGLCNHLLDKDTTEDSLREYIYDLKEDASICHERTKAAQEIFLQVYSRVLGLSKDLPDHVLKDSPKSFVRRVVHFFSWNGKQRSMEIKEVMKELNLVALDLARLSGSVAAFADWWGTMVTKLATLESGVNRLKPQPGKNVARIELLRKDWEDIEHKYEAYRNDIAKLKYSYPRDLMLE